MEEIGARLVAAGAAGYIADLQKADSATQAFARGIGDAAAQAEKGNSLFSGLGSVAGGAVTAGFAAAAGAAVAVGAALVDVSARASQARTTLQGVGEVNFDQVLNDASLLEARYGTDLQSVLGATRTLMSEFGLSSEEANNLIIAGFEGGLDASGDFLDSIGEYSNLFAENGATADQFFSTLESGLAGGALGTDKAADAFKEFGIRIQDGSDSTREALANLGIEEVLTGISDGSVSAADAFGIVQEALSGIEDPIAQAQLGVALFGTQFEDLGASAVLGIDLAASSMEDISASADSGRERIASLGEIFPRLWAAGSNALLPLNDALLGMVNAVLTADDPLAELGNQIGMLGGKLQEAGGKLLGWIQEQLPGWIAGLGQMGQKLGTWVQEALPGLLANLATAGTALVGWVGEQLPGWAANLGQLGQRLMAWVVDALPGLGTNLGQVAALLIEKAGEFLAVAVPKLAELGVAFVTWVATDVLPNLPGALAEIGGALLTALGNFASEVGPPLSELGQQFIDWVGTEVLPALPGQLASIGTTIVSGISGFIGSVGAEAAKVGTAIIDGIKGAISAGAGAIAGAARQAAQAALDAAKALLGIKSPSQAFAEEVGLPIIEGLARGLLDNLDVLLDAAQQISWAVLDEARGFARTVAGALGPLLAEGYQGAIDYAAAQIDANDLLAALLPGGDAALDTGVLDRLGSQLAQQDRRWQGLVDQVEQTELDAIAKAESIMADFDRKQADLLAKGQADTGGLEAEAARLRITAAQNYDPAKREAAAKKLAEIEEQIRKKQADQGKQLADLEAERNRRLADVEAAAAKKRTQLEQQINDVLIQRQYLAERYAAAEADALERQRRAQEQILAQRAAADRAALAVREAEAAAAQLADPAERGAFLQLRIRQIQAIAEAEQRLAAAGTEADRTRLQANLDLLRAQHQAEAQLFTLEAEQRQAEQTGALRDARSALEQLGSLIYFSQQDLHGVGSEAIRGIARGMIEGVEHLSRQLGGAFDSVIADLRRQLGISSPSRLFADAIGAPLAEGVGAGFTQALDRITPTLTAQVAGTATPLATAAQLTTYHQRSTVYQIGPMDLRGAAPGVGGEVTRAIQAALAAAGARADQVRRVG